MVRTALGSGMLGADGVGRRVVAVAADAAEIDDGTERSAMKTSGSSYRAEVTLACTRHH